MRLIDLAMLLAVPVEQTPSPTQRTPASSPTQHDPAPQQSSEVVVVGRAPDAVGRYVEQLTQVRGGRQLARWNQPACLRLLGLDEPHESYVFQRMAAAARPLPVLLRGGTCHGDIVIVFTRDAKQVAEYVTRRFPALFQGTGQGVSFLARIRADLLRPRPVRWTNASRTGPAAGGTFAGGVNNIYSASRLQETTRENAYRSLVIVDLGAMDRVTWAQLVDYLLMVTLANPSMDACYGDDTIMSLFRLRDEGGTSPAGLTADDRAFLAALYTTNPAATASVARAQIGSAITARAP